MNMSSFDGHCTRPHLPRSMSTSALPASSEVTSKRLNPLVCRPNDRGTSPLPMVAVSTIPRCMAHRRMNQRRIVRPFPFAPPPSEYVLTLPPTVHRYSNNRPRRFLRLRWRVLFHQPAIHIADDVDIDALQNIERVPVAICAHPPSRV